MSGYEMKQVFDKSLAHLWTAYGSQIYPTLYQMKKKGLVHVEMVTQKGGPSKKVYTLSRKGEGLLKSWLEAPIPEVPVRNPFLLRFFFSRYAGREATLKHLRERLKHSQERLELYTDMASLVNEIFAPTQERSTLEESDYWLLTLRLQMIHEEGNIRWCHEALGRLESNDARA